MNAITNMAQLSGIEQIRAIFAGRTGYEGIVKTLELKIAYHRALTDSSGPVRAEGRVVSHGRRAAFAEGKLFDKDGALCATATTTCLVFEAQPQ